jgi:phage/plasmid-like protein (TIGR03299 family)
MSAETSEWLNRNTLIGFTNERGHAWHWRQSDQGNEPNHYPGAIPVADVHRRLFDFTVEKRAQIVADANGQPVYSLSGEGEITYATNPNQVALVASDNGDVLGTASPSYNPHQYGTWLVDHVARLLDGDLQIGSAGLLRNRSVAWVQVEVAETIKTPEGVDFRPHLTAATSFDQSLPTTYHPEVGLVVCDNTLAAGLAESGPKVRIKHTSASQFVVADARQALDIVLEAGDAFAAQVTDLCNWTVSQAEWARLLDLNVPVPADKGRARTIATNKRDALGQLWTSDKRVSPWRGTAFGVLQAFNTFDTHIKTVKGAERFERAQLDALGGIQAKADNAILASLAGVTGRQLVAA